MFAACLDRLSSAEVGKVGWLALDRVRVGVVCEVLQEDFRTIAVFRSQRNILLAVGLDRAVKHNYCWAVVAIPTCIVGDWRSFRSRRPHVSFVADTLALPPWHPYTMSGPKGRNIHLAAPQSRKTTRRMEFTKGKVSSHSSASLLISKKHMSCRTYSKQST